VELSITSMDIFKIVTISGKVDWENARKLDQKIKSIIKEGFYHIVFNLDEVTFICSGGVGAIIYNLNKVKKINGAIYLISSNEYVNYIFETLKFNIIFDGYLFRSFQDFSEKILNKKI
jgi:anti-anti-sigma factor